MDLRSGYPFWLVAHGLPRPYPPLEQNIDCDVVVLGGGITGALISYHLVQAGFDTVVIDKRDIGWGSTSATTGLIQYEIDTPLGELASMLGTDHAVRAYRACWSVFDKLETIMEKIGDRSAYRRRSSVQLASRKQDVASLRSEFELRRAHGFELDWWDARDLRDRFPFRRPAALFTHDAADIDPYRATYALLAYAVQHRARVFDRTEVVSIEHSRTDVRLKTNRGHDVRAERIVFATGYESEQYLKRKAAKLVSTYALASEPVELDSWFEQCLLWETAHPYLYLRTTSDNRVMIGGEDENFVDPNRRDRLIARKARALERKFARLFPTIPIETAFAWAGTFAQTHDGLAYIGATPDFPNAHFALCYGGNGITYAVLAGEIIRDALLGRANEHAHLFRFGR